MRKWLLAMALMLGLSQSAQAQFFRDWDSRDQALLAIGTTLHMIDWGQTRYIAKNPSEYREMNPLMGDHPSMGTVNSYMLVTALLFPLAAEMFPEYRTYILAFWVGSRALVVGNNYAIGIRMSW